MGAPKPTRWVIAPFGVFELRFGQRAILHSPKGSSRRHDYSVEEIVGHARYSWAFTTEEKARELIAAYHKGD